MSYIELWEELFDLDLYAYRLKFVDRNTQREITCLMEADRDSNSVPKVELVV